VDHETTNRELEIFRRSLPIGGKRSRLDPYQCFSPLPRPSWTGPTEFNGGSGRLPNFVRFWPKCLQRNNAACGAKIAEDVSRGRLGKEIVKGQEIVAGGLPQRPSDRPPSAATNDSARMGTTRAEADKSWEMLERELSIGAPSRVTQTQDRKVATLKRRPKSPPLPLRHPS